MLFDQNLLTNLATQACGRSRSYKWWIDTGLQVRKEFQSMLQNENWEKVSEIFGILPSRKEDSLIVSSHEGMSWK